MTWIAWVKNSQITSNCGVDNVFDDYLLDCYLNYLIQINDHGFTDYCKWLAPCNLPVSKGQSRCSALPLAGQPYHGQSQWHCDSLAGRWQPELVPRPLAWATAQQPGPGRHSHVTVTVTVLVTGTPWFAEWIFMSVHSFFLYEFPDRNTQALLSLISGHTGRRSPAATDGQGLTISLLYIVGV